MQEFTVFCDAGSVRLGLGDNFYYIPNGYGDGKCTVEVYDISDDFDGRGSYEAIVEGSDIKLYDYDCGNAKVIAILSGCYRVFILSCQCPRYWDSPAIALVRFADYEVDNE